MIKQTTKGERILLLRRRADKSQRQASVEMGVTLYRYRKWELDEDDPPDLRIGDLFPYEACLLLRRRMGVSLWEMAAEMNISRQWLCKMEYGKVSSDRLVAYWESKTKPWRRPASEGKRVGGGSEIPARSAAPTTSA